MTGLSAALSKMKELEKLPVGWNYGKGGPLSGKARIFSILTLHFLDSIGAKRFDVLPSDDGGATLLASFNDEIAEIVVQKNGRLDLFLEAANCIDAEGLDFGELLSALEEAGWKSLKSSGSQTHVFSVESTEDSRVKLLPTMGLDLQLSRLGALNRRVHRFATISKNTTVDSEESPQYFFDSHPRALLTAHG